MSRLGYTIKAGLDFIFDKTVINAIGYTFSAEASDVLITRDDNYKLEYKGMFGNIKPGKNLLNLEGDDDIVVHRAHNFMLFETFYFSTGRFFGPGYPNRKTKGFGLSTDGLFNLLAVNINDRGAKFIFDHVSINYSYAKVFPDTDLESIVDGICVSYRNLFF